MKRLLLTGGSGFIGRNILESYLADRYEILAPGHSELDVADDTSVERFFRENRVDFVIHAALKPTHRNAKDPTNLFFSNTRMFFNLARFGDGYERMLVLGSGAIYDQRRRHPLMTEEEWKAHVPADDLGLYKYVCGTYIEKHSNIIDLRPFGVFGKHEDYAIRFISNMICKALFDLPLTIKQDRLFDYIYIDDLIPVLEFFLENEPRHEAYNVTSGSPVLLTSLAESVLRILGKDLPVVVASGEVGPEYSGSNSRLRAEMPSFRLTDREASISALAEWYRRNRHSVDPRLLVTDR